MRFLQNILKYLLLLAPCIAALWVPIYNRIDPTLFGFPAFYWLQLALVPVSALFIWLAYMGDKE